MLTVTLENWYLLEMCGTTGMEWLIGAGPMLRTGSSQQNSLTEQKSPRGSMSNIIDGSKNKQRQQSEAGNCRLHNKLNGSIEKKIKKGIYITCGYGRLLSGKRETGTNKQNRKL